jgi:hypothetical protein
VLKKRGGETEHGGREIMREKKHERERDSQGELVSKGEKESHSSTTQCAVCFSR